MPPPSLMSTPLAVSVRADFTPLKRPQLRNLQEYPLRRPVDGSGLHTACVLEQQDLMGDKIPALGRRKLPWLARSAREDRTRKRGVEVLRSATPAAPDFIC